MRARRVLRGVLRDGDGKPLARTRVHLRGCNGDAPDHVKPGHQGPEFILGGYLAQRSTVTDEQGRFWFGDLAAGDYAIGSEVEMLEVRVQADRDPEPLELRK